MDLPLLGYVPSTPAVLLLGWACLLYGGMLHPEQPGKNRRMPRWMRLGSSLALVAFAAIRCTSLGGRTWPVISFALFAGIAMGAVGDFCLAEVFPVAQPMIAGLGAFAVGHVFYVVVLVGLLADYGPSPAVLGACVGMVALSVVGWRVLVYPSSRSARLRWMALGYAVLLASMTGLAIGLGGVAGFAGGPRVAVGATLFWVSDVLLAARIFRGAHFRLLDDWVWLTYGTGQMLIVVGCTSFLPIVRVFQPVH